jgi:hypothetical protein
VIERVDTFSRNAAGTLIINPRKLDIQSFWLSPDAPNNPVVVGAGASSGPLPCSVSQDGPFEGFYLVHERLNNTLVFVDAYDEGAKLRLVNRQVHIDTIFGRRITGAGPVAAGMIPHLFAETLWIHATRSIIFTFVDGAAGNTIWPIVVGRRFYNYANPSEELAVAIEKRTARARLSSPFWMTLDTASPANAAGDLALAPGGTGLGFIKVPTVGHFEWGKLMSMSTGAYRFRLFDSRNGRAVTNDWIHVNAGTGAGPLPLVLPEPTLFQPNTQLRVEFVDLSGAPNTVYFTLAGRMIYVG